MPMNVHVEHLDFNSFSRLKCVVNHSRKASEKTLVETTPNFNIGGLATVALQFEDKDSVLICRILAKNYTSAATFKVKVTLSCQDVDKPVHSDFICDDRWKDFGSKQTCTTIFLNNIYTDVLDVNVSVYKVPESFVVKLYNDVCFTDFKLSTPEGSIAVHRACLAAYSDVFQAMLSKEWKETSEGRIQIDGVTLQTLQHLKDYMYLQTLPMDGLDQLLLLASYYLIDSLKMACVSKLAITSKPADWCYLLEFSVVNKIPELMHAIQMMVNPALNPMRKILG